MSSLSLEQNPMYRNRYRIMIIAAMVIMGSEINWSIIYLVPRFLAVLATTWTVLTAIIVFIQLAIKLTTTTTTHINA